MNIKITFIICHPWTLFKMIELTEIIRQKDDQPFTELLNRFRTASQTEEDIKVIQSKASPCEMAFGIPRNFFLGIPRNKGVNFHGKFGLGIPRNSQP